MLAVDDRFVFLSLFRLLIVCASIQPFLSTIPIFGVADVNPPPSQPDRVDGAAGLNKQTDRVGELVLAAVRGLHEMVRVENSGCKSQSSRGYLAGRRASKRLR
jgi:hypothetical protein